MIKWTDFEVQLYSLDLICCLMVFFSCPVDEASVKYASFVTPLGISLCTPFGLCISPLMFQQYVNFIFCDIQSDLLLAYMDDFIVIVPDIDEGLAQLKIVL